MGASLLAVGFAFFAAGCRTQQSAHIVKPGEKEMVGSHEAGAETFGPLVDTAVNNLLARHSQSVQPAGFTNNAPPAPLRICFVGVENQSAEEMGDFKQQLYQQIDSRILASQIYQSVSQRYVAAGLHECGLRPDQLLIPANMQRFAAALEQQGQPFDFMLYATITSGTTRDNKDYQRSYLLTLEMLNVHNGQSDKESAELEKKYDVSAAAKIKSWNPFK
ncbi:MAG: penicillin-binding protein activator LpoB [Pirellulales bacterium]|nr:penicillin-binding protein activator LpoB [Pirellulales bacterium]